MLQQNEPKDYVIATGEAHSVGEFVQLSFEYLGLDWRKYVRTDPKFFRPAEVNYLKGDSALARKELGWEPKVGFEEFEKMIVDSDMKLLEKKARV